MTKILIENEPDFIENLLGGSVNKHNFHKLYFYYFITLNKFPNFRVFRKNIKDDDDIHYTIKQVYYDLHFECDYLLFLNPDREKVLETIEAYVKTMTWIFLDNNYKVYSNIFNEKEFKLYLQDYIKSFSIKHL